MKYFKFVLLIIMLTTTHLQAQWNYVVDVVGGDSTALVKPMKTKGGLAKCDTISWLHNGDTVFSYSFSELIFLIFRQSF